MRIMFVLVAVVAISGICVSAPLQAPIVPQAPCCDQEATEVKKDVCECSAGGPCTCGPNCQCEEKTIPVQCVNGNCGVSYAPRVTYTYQTPTYRYVTPTYYSPSYAPRSYSPTYYTPTYSAPSYGSYRSYGSPSYGTPTYTPSYSTPSFGGGSAGACAGGR